MRPTRTLASLLVLAATSPLYAQRTQVGVKGSLNSNTYADVYSARSSANRLGFAAGGFLRHRLGKHLSLQPELLYELRRVKTVQDGQLGWEGIIGSYTRQERSRFHVVSLPLLLRGQAGKFVGLAGPQLGYLLATQQQATTNYMLWSSTSYDLPYPEAESSTSTKAFRRWEVGYTAGVGYQISSRLALEVRYTAGVTRLQKPYKVNVETYMPITTSPLAIARSKTWQAQVSYQLTSL